jgi:hypothetical protein
MLLVPEGIMGLIRGLRGYRFLAQGAAKKG